MHATSTIETKGSKTVHLRSTKNGLQRVTVPICLTAAGSQLPSLLIFKGKESDSQEYFPINNIAELVGANTLAGEVEAGDNESLANGNRAAV